MKLNLTKTWELVMRGKTRNPPLGLEPSLKESFRGSFKYWEYPFMRINATGTLTFICDEQG